MPDLSQKQFSQPSLFNATDFAVDRQPKGGLMGEDWYVTQRRGSRRSPMGSLAMRQRNYDNLPEDDQRLTTRPVAPQSRESGASLYHPDKPGTGWNWEEGYAQQAQDPLLGEMLSDTPAQNPYAVERMQRTGGFRSPYQRRWTGTEQIPTQEFGPGGSIATHQPPFQTRMEHAARMQDVQGLPPVHVKEFPSGMGLTDGNHRVTEALRNGRLWVDADVYRLDYDMKEPDEYGRDYY